MQSLNSKSDIVLDFDGTICSLAIDWIQWHYEIGKIFSKFDKTFDLHLKDKPVHTYQNQFFDKYGTKLQRQITKFEEKFESKNLKGYKISEKVMKIIQSVRANLYIWSSNSGRTIKNVLRELEIESKFKKIISRDSTFFIKPHPEGFNLIFDNTSKDKYVFIGDSEFDRSAAQNAGIDFIDVKDLA